MKKLINEQGISLIQVVIAAGLMSMLGLVMMRMQENQLKTQNDIGARAEVVSFMKKFNSLMASPGYCQESLKGQLVNGAKKITLDKVIAPNGKVILEVGELYGDRQILLKSIEQKNFFFDDVAKTRGILGLTISLEKNKKSMGAKTIRKTAEVFVSVNASGAIEACSSSGLDLTSGAGAIETASIKKVIEKSAAGEEIKELDEKNIKKIIEGNPALKEMQEAIKNLKKANQAMEKMYDD